jgi:hypothetical protein
MAGVQVTIPGQAGILESRQALMDAAVRQQFSIFSATPAGNAPDPVSAPGSNRPLAPAGFPALDANVRQPSASNLGRPLQTTRLG